MVKGYTYKFLMFNNLSVVCIQKRFENVKLSKHWHISNSLNLFQVMEPKVIKEEAVEKETTNYSDTSSTTHNRTRSSKGKWNLSSLHEGILTVQYLEHLRISFLTRESVPRFLQSSQLRLLFLCNKKSVFLFFYCHEYLTLYLASFTSFFVVGFEFVTSSRQFWTCNLPQYISSYQWLCPSISFYIDLMWITLTRERVKTNEENKQDILVGYTTTVFL